MENVTNVEAEEKRNFTLSKDSILGSIAKWAVRQSPYHRPDNLEIVLDKMYELIKDDFDDGKKYCMFFDSSRDAEKYISERLHRIPEFLLWNERKNGRQGHGFTSAGHHDDGSVTLQWAKADDDFIDLDALTRNATSDALNH